LISSFFIIIDNHFFTIYLNFTFNYKKMKAWIVFAIIISDLSDKIKSLKNGLFTRMIKEYRI